MDKNMFADGIGLECFYDAEHVLFATAKFLVHLLGEGLRRGEMVGTGRPWEEDGERMVWYMGMHEKTTKMQQIWHLGTPPGVSYIFRKLFSGKTFLSEIVCLYLEPFKSNKSFKLDYCLAGSMPLP